MPRRGLADLHIHTSFSDGRPSPEQVVEHVLERTDLDLIAITDHDTIEGALRAAELGRQLGLAVIVGEEVSSRHGHILGLFLEKRVGPGLSAAATVEAIHAQGGLAIAAHPFWRQRAHGIGWLLSEVGVDGIEVENSTPGLGLSNIQARRFNVKAALTEIGSSDAHITDAIGKAYTSFPGRTPEALRTAFGRRRTRAHRRRYDAATLLRYAAWGITLHRSAAVAEALQ